MVQNFLVVATQVVTLFLLMAVGFAMTRLGRLGAEGVSQMSTLVLYVVTPCVIIHSFQIRRTPGMGGRLLACGGLYLLCSLVCILAAQALFRREAPERRAPLRYSLVYGNVGFMGLPLLLSILGENALIYGAVIVVLFNLLCWTHGVWVMGGRVTPRQVLINPATIGFAAALPLFLTGWQLPAMVGSAVDFLADLNTPLAMVVIGAQMAGADLKASFTTPKLYVAAAFRLLAAPLVALLLLFPLGLDPTLYCACVILTATPIAGATGMFSQRFGKDTALAAQLVTLSTLLSVLTLPLMAVAAQTLSGLL